MNTGKIISSQKAREAKTDWDNAPKIRVGVVGVRGGESFAKGATEVVGMELVAICDIWKERLAEAGRQFGVATYEDYDKFLEHDMAPLMVITDTMPVTVNALSIPAPELGPNLAKRGDPGSVILCRMDNNAVFRLFGIWIPGHSNWYRVHGTHGAMEIARGPGYFGPGQVRGWHEEWDCPADTPRERTYLPDWPEHGDLAKKAGHGGGDFWTNFHFANAIRSGQQPYLDVYRGVTMSSGANSVRCRTEFGRHPGLEERAGERQAF
ncbi:MAG: hypothetical protein HY326_03390 [Chloroflexi bacterium]|nr:hypothetical protein [Chloroflexota bacterium]